LISRIARDTGTLTQSAWSVEHDENTGDRTTAEKLVAYVGAPNAVGRRLAHLQTAGQLGHRESTARMGRQEVEDLNGAFDGRASGQ
jgi:hypothetical protein